IPSATKVAPSAAVVKVTLAPDTSASDVVTVSALLHTALYVTGCIRFSRPAGTISPARNIWISSQCGPPRVGQGQRRAGGDGLDHPVDRGGVERHHLERRNPEVVDVDVGRPVRVAALPADTH